MFQLPWGSSASSSCVVSESYFLSRYIRREKQISDTKMEMSQSQRIRLQESCDHLQRKLTETEKMLAEERERNTMNMKTAEEHTAILAKVQIISLITVYLVLCVMSF